jgi:tetratricopeptide (TPR) repeat protein
MNCVTVSIENDPKNAFYYYDCAYKYYYGLKNVNAAKKYAKEALKLNSNHEKTKELLLKIESMKIN